MRGEGGGGREGGGREGGGRGRGRVVSEGVHGKIWVHEGVGEGVREGRV